MEMNARLSFKQIAEAWRALPRNPAGTRVVGKGKRSLLRVLTDSEVRGWFQACCVWIAGGPSPYDYPEIQEILGYFDDYQRNMAEAHLECAGLILPHSPAPPAGGLNSIARLRGIPLEFLQELSREFRQGQPREKVGKGQQVVFPLTWGDEGKKEGVLLRFVFEMLPDGRGEVFPAPAQAFITLDGGFTGSFAAAHSATRALPGSGLADSFDVRVRVEPLYREALPGLLTLRGPSGGAALALGMAKSMAADDILKAVDLTGIVISAEVGQRGRLEHVGDIVPKIKAILQYKERGFGIYVLVVAQSQEIDEDLRRHLSKLSLLIVEANNLREAIRRLYELQSKTVLNVLRQRLVIAAFLLGGAIWFWLGLVILLPLFWYFLPEMWFVGIGAIWCLSIFLTVWLQVELRARSIASPLLLPEETRYPAKLWAGMFASLEEDRSPWFFKRLCACVGRWLSKNPTKELTLEAISKLGFLFGSRSYWAYLRTAILILMLATLLSPLQHDLGERLPPSDEVYFAGGISRIDGQQSEFKPFSAMRPNEPDTDEMTTDVGASGLLRLHVTDKPRTNRYLRVISERIEDQRGQFHLRATGDGPRQKAVVVSVANGEATFYYCAVETDHWKMKLTIRLIDHSNKVLRSAVLAGNWTPGSRQ